CRSYARARRGRPRRLGRAVALDERPQARLQRGREAPVRHDLLLVVSRRTADHPRRPEGRPAAEEEAGEATAQGDDDDDVDDPYDDRSVTSIAAASSAGMRVGRSVFASTQAGDVQRSATSWPSRAIT